MYFYPPYLLILFALIITDYVAAIVIEKASTEKKQKRWLVISLIANVGMLAFFKYYNFLNGNIDTLCQWVGWNNPIPALHILLPIGLSFHTFQSMAYTIEVYNGNVKAEKNFGIYALYVMFYPQLVAGPIERATTLLPQLKKNDNKLDYDHVMIGLSQMTIGFFKKVAVADTLALYVNSIYKNHQFNEGLTSVFATWMFAFQVYCDFSGYTDIAIGAGRVMGYNMSINFKLPFFSKSITEFWRRWHISLYSWFNDYVFIPLSYNFRHWGKYGMYLVILITFSISGIWHGASWKYMIWGVANGMYIVIESVLKINTERAGLKFYKKVFFTFLTFQMLTLTMVFFRADNVTEAWDVLSSFFNFHNWFNLRISDTSIFINMISMLVLLLGFEYAVLRKNTIETFYKKSSPILFGSVITCFLILILLFGVSDGDQFIYFQF